MRSKDQDCQDDRKAHADFRQKIPQSVDAGINVIKFGFAHVLYPNITTPRSVDKLNFGYRMIENFARLSIFCGLTRSRIETITSYSPGAAVLVGNSFARTKR